MTKTRGRSMAYLVREDDISRLMDVNRAGLLMMIVYIDFTFMPERFHDRRRPGRPALARERGDIA